MRQLSKRMVSGDMLHMKQKLSYEKLRTITLDGARLTLKEEFDALSSKRNFIVSIN